MSRSRLKATPSSLAILRPGTAGSKNDPASNERSTGPFIVEPVDPNEPTLHHQIKMARMGPLLFGGEGGIRTHDTLARIPVFETGTFNHSATSPILQLPCHQHEPEPVLAPARAQSALNLHTTQVSLHWRKLARVPRPVHSTTLPPPRANARFYQRAGVAASVTVPKVRWP
jgi:hypothetical protein